MALCSHLVIISANSFAVSFTLCSHLVIISATVSDFGNSFAVLVTLLQYPSVAINIISKETERSNGKRKQLGRRMLSSYE